MPPKKSVKKVPVVAPKAGFKANATSHKNFLAVLILFAGVSMYAIASMVTSNNKYLDHLSADVTSSDVSGGQKENQVVVDKKNPFSDLTTDNPSYDAIISLYYAGILGGYTDGTFRPDNKVNRAEFSKMIVEASDLDYTVLPAVNLANCFGDVKDLPVDWFAPAVCASKYKGWVNGYGAGDFGPSKRIVKAEGLKIIMKAFGIKVPENSEIKEPPYADVNLAADWFAGVAQAAKDNNIVKSAIVFNGSYALSRADLATLIYNAMKVKNLIK